MSTARRTRGVLAATFALVALVAALVGTPVTATAAANPYERGPAPTTSSIESSRGPYATASATVSRYSVTGFGGGTVYYPTSTADGTFGVVAISPGYTATQSSISWLGPRLASQGFVVFTIDTNGRYDQPGSRADQLAAALDYLVERSSVRSRIDATRLAVMGHSMGGGGAIEAASDDTSLKAAIALTPYHLTKTWSRVRTPTLVVGAQDDDVAPTRTHAIPLYNGIPSSTPKAYLELRGASHFAPNSSNTTIAATSIAWLKRWVDDDTRYTTFLSPGPGVGTATSDWRRSGY